MMGVHTQENLNDVRHGPAGTKKRKYISMMEKIAHRKVAAVGENAESVGSITFEHIHGPDYIDPLTAFKENGIFLNSQPSEF